MRIVATPGWKKKVVVALAVAVSAAFLISAPVGVTAGAIRNSRLDSRVPARDCAEGRLPGRPLGTGDAAFLRRFSLCVAREERAQIGYGFRTDPGLSRSLGRLVQGFLVPDFEAEGRDRKADAVIARGMRSLASRDCGGAGPPYRFTVDDTHAPPSPTPYALAAHIAAVFEGDVYVLDSERARFGFVAGPDLYFRGEDHEGVHSALIGVLCSRPAGTGPGAGPRPRR